MSIRLNNLTNHLLAPSQPDITVESSHLRFICTELIYTYTKKTIGYTSFYNPFSTLSTHVSLNIVIA